MRTSWWIAGFSALKSWQIPLSNCPFRMEGGGLQIPNEHDEWMDVILTFFKKNMLQRNRGSHLWIPNHRVVIICIMIYITNTYKYCYESRYLNSGYVNKWWTWTFDDARVSTCMMWIEKPLVLLTQPWDEDLPSSVARWLNRADGVRIARVILGRTSFWKDERSSPSSSW